MRDPEIGFYVHHQGRGHLQRARAIASRLPHPVTLFSSLVADHRSNGVEYCHLDPDYNEQCVVEAFDHLHYAPLCVPGVRSRAKRLTAWFEDHWPCVLVVDVSVEVATLARLCGVPVIYVRQRGQRFDTAHTLAYASATRLLAPYPADWDEMDTPAEWRDKTDYVGVISRYEHLVGDHAEPIPRFDRRQRTVTIITGFGGTALTAHLMLKAARLCPDWAFTVIGCINHGPSDGPPNLTFVGIVDDPLPWLADADVVVGSAGDSLVSEVAHLQKRFVCIPESRPFGEQRSTAAVLARLDLAVVLPTLPDASNWPALLQSALGRDPARWQRWVTGGSNQAARAISRVVQVSLTGSH